MLSGTSAIVFDEYKNASESVLQLRGGGGQHDQLGGAWRRAEFARRLHDHAFITPDVNRSASTFAIIVPL